MKKIIIFSLFFMASVLLSGCKIEQIHTVNFSDLISKKPKEIESELIVEVSSCENYEDSRKESSSLIRAKSSIISIFPSAKYLGCHRERAESKATFKIPLHLNTENKLDGICIGMVDENLYIRASRDVIDGLKKIKETTFSEIDPLITFIFKNDTDESKMVTLLSVFENDKGYLVLDKEIKKGGKITATLSNASTDEIFWHGYVNIGRISPITKK